LATSLERKAEEIKWQISEEFRVAQKDLKWSQTLYLEGVPLKLVPHHLSSPLLPLLDCHHPEEV